MRTGAVQTVECFWKPVLSMSERDAAVRESALSKMGDLVSVGSVVQAGFAENA